MYEAYETYVLYLTIPIYSGWLPASFYHVYRFIHEELFAHMSSELLFCYFNYDPIYLEILSVEIL